MKYKALFAGVTLLLLSVIPSGAGLLAGERVIADLRDFTKIEVKSAGLSFSNDVTLHVKAVGAFDVSDQMVAGGWIIDASTRREVWRMHYAQTRSSNDDRTFDDWVSLPRGSYEIYYAAYGYASSSGFTSFTINVDRRRGVKGDTPLRRWGFLSWLEDLFDGDMEKEWTERAAAWGITISVDDRTTGVDSFTPPMEFQNVLLRVTTVGENDNITKGFVLDAPLDIRIYAIGEYMGGEPDDFGWIVDTKTRKRIWSLSDTRRSDAGGSSKNVLSDKTLKIPPGSYILHYISDDSHSPLDWNAEPPRDPLNYGVTLIGSTPEDKAHCKVGSVEPEKNVIVQLTKVGDNESVSETFGVKSDTRIRVYAIGERSSGRDMADYGWIVNAKTRERAWSMEVSRTEPAGGGSKNRLVDEVITLPTGTYTVYYTTDGSHAFGDWNAPPPYDPEHWGITVYGADDAFDMRQIERKVSISEEGLIAQIVRIKDDENRTRNFTISKPTNVRVYAIGEGEGREMFDYGWIERAKDKSIIWEMTYAMTFHAGGARKNRMVNTTIYLDKGDYVLHYVSDDSHSFNDWNSAPPEDPSMWGISLWKAE